jgi:nucleoside-diphosphate-sugar epimerase
MKKRALVCGAGGFIGSHLMKRLKEEEYYVVGVDVKPPPYWYNVNESLLFDKFRILDLANKNNFTRVMREEGNFDEIYQLAADMGGAGYIFSGNYDTAIMLNSGLINANLCSILYENPELIKGLTVFFSSSACIYPQENQVDRLQPITRESSAYPANPDSEYGWEKLYSERLYFALNRNLGLNVKVARFHNVYGPYGAYNDGREKVIGALCRKIAMLPAEGGEIDIWGDGNQTRSFLYIDECIEGVRRFMHKNFNGPLNIGSSYILSINELAKMIANIAEKKINLHHIKGPLGVRGRYSDNALIQEKLDWAPSMHLLYGITKTYEWIDGRINGSQTTKK